MRTSKYRSSKELKGGGIDWQQKKTACWAAATAGSGNALPRRCRPLKYDSLLPSIAGDAAGLREWLAKGGNVNAPAPGQLSRELLIHRAAAQGQTECMQASKAYKNDSLPLFSALQTVLFDFYA